MLGEIESKIASQLLDNLKESCSDKVQIKVEGAGLHWHVDATHANRSIQIACFHYDDNDGAFVLGMQGNSHQSKVSVGKRPEYISGAEYYAEYYLDGDTKTTGRTRDIVCMVNSVSDWLTSEVELDTLYEKHLFIDSKRKVLRRIAKTINEQLLEIGSKFSAKMDNESLSMEFSELWIYGSERACRLEELDNDLISGAFLLKRTQLAKIEGTAATMALAIKSWFDLERGTDELENLSSQFSRDPFASCFEAGEYSKWHWQHVLQQAEGSDVLNHYKPLIERISKSDIVSKFFSFTSLHRLCLSRSSLYPFDTKGLPYFYPNNSKEKPYSMTYNEDKFIKGNEDEIMSILENDLILSPKPYFGNIDDYLFVVFNEAMKQMGSRFRAEKEFQKQWVKIIVQNNKGKMCKLSLNVGDELLIEFYKDGADQKMDFKGPLDAAAHMVHNWLNK